jgi:hypothetical protein
MLTLFEAAQTEAISIEISIATHWNSYTKQAAYGYDFIAYTGTGDKKTKLVTKDWSDDGVVTDVNFETEAGFAGVNECIRNLKPILNGLGTPSIRIYTETTWQSAVIKPQKGYRLNLPKQFHPTTFAIKNALETINSYPEKVFSRGSRRAERTAPNFNAHKKRFTPIKRRIRMLVDPTGDKQEKLWINLAHIKNLIDNQEHDGKRSRLTPAIFYHLRDERRIPLKTIQKLTGAKSSEINRSANTFTAKNHENNSAPDYFGASETCHSIGQ